MCKDYCFFKPRVIKETYQHGFHGYRTLIVGASLPCYPEQYNCTIKDMCKYDTSLCDKICPPYANFEDKEYYCLSNSNEIEIQSYIEGSCHSHLFDRICKHMAGTCKTEEEKKNFWNQVAFTNYHQNIYVAPWNYPNLPSYVEDTDKNFNAFLEILEEWKPEIIYFYKGVKDIILNRCIDGLEEIMCLSTEKEIELCPFLYNISSKDEPKNIVQEFIKHFSSTNYLEGTILHALFKARRYNSYNLDHEYEISDEMILFVEKHAWDINLYKYLVNQIEKELGLDLVINYIKNKVITNNMKIASTFGINGVECNPIIGYTPSELSLFSMQKHKTLQEIVDYDLILYYFDENTPKKKIKETFVQTSNPNQIIGIIIKMEDLDLYEKKLLETERIKEIHNIENKFLYMKMLNAFFPINTISIFPNVETDSPKALSVNLNHLQSKGLKNFIDNYTKYPELIEKYSSLLGKLEENGWIETDNGKYKFIEKKLKISSKTIKRFIGKEDNKKDYKKDKEISPKATKGGLYLWLAQEGKATYDDIKEIFIYEERPIKDCINDFRRSCNKADITIGEGEVLDNLLANYFAESMK